MAQESSSNSSFDFKHDERGRWSVVVEDRLTSRTVLGIQTFNGSVYVDIRDYFVTSVPDGSTTLKPKKSGVTLSKNEYLALAGECGKKIQENLEELVNSNSRPYKFLRVAISERTTVETTWDSINYGPLTFVVKITKSTAEFGKPGKLKVSSVNISPNSWKLISEINKDQITLMVDVAEKSALIAAKQMAKQMADEQKTRLNMWLNNDNGAV